MSIDRRIMQNGRKQNAKSRARARRRILVVSQFLIELTNLVSWLGGSCLTSCPPANTRALTALNMCYLSPITNIGFTGRCVGSRSMARFGTLDSSLEDEASSTRTQLRRNRRCSILIQDKCKLHNPALNPLPLTLARA